MKNTWKATSICLPLLLVACGGSVNNETGELPRKAILAGSAPSQHLGTPAEYYDVLQRLYLVFLGRPADYYGLQFWANTFNDQHLPTTVADLADAYASNEAVRAVIDLFANSPESRLRYVDSRPAFINTVYQSLFNRNADPEGSAFWSAALADGKTSHGQFVLWIMNGAQKEDATVFENKTRAALRFTAALDGAAEINSYSYEAVFQSARELMSTITASTDLVAFQGQIDDFQRNMGLSTPAVAHYYGFNYLQDMDSGPSYMAYYHYSDGAIAPPPVPPSGNLIYGVRPSTVSWSRDAGGAILYAAPFTASAAIGPARTTPALTMLCQPVPGENGNARSTDILVSIQAHRIVNASELANQTLTVYRENCALGGSGITSLAFDAGGGLTMASANGSSVYSPELVTRILGGQVMPDLVTKKIRTFSAYSFIKSDGLTAYAVVLHTGASLTELSSGELALWSQQ